jgi:peptide deformylase
MPNPDVIGISHGIKGRQRPLMTWPDDADFLHTPCDEVIEFDDILHQDVADMFVSLENNNDGIALAANQVGILLRMFVASLPYANEQPSVSPTSTPEYETEFEHIVCINPQIEDKGSSYSYEEGCLSIPGYYSMNKRCGYIKLRYFSPRGRSHVREFWGLHAFAIQHEIDHLDGKLMIDDYSQLKKNMVRKKVAKFLRHLRANAS